MATPYAYRRHGLPLASWIRFVDALLVVVTAVRQYQASASDLHT